MDRITKSLLESFATEHELNQLTEDKQFEHFVNYSVVSKLHRATFDLEAVNTGNGNDAAIDGIAIIVNGKLIENKDELSDIVQESGYLDCDIVFIQTKTSSSFQSSEIGSFVFGVKDFISDKPRLVQNEFINNFKEIWEEVINKSSLMINRNPNCRLYYVTTGKWTNDQNLSAVIASGKTEIEDSGLFKEVTFLPFGANEIQKLYHETKNKLSATIKNFQNRIALPDIIGVKEAYLGLLPFDEFMALVQDENETILSIFDDNVRDFQGDNEVNKKIKSTLHENKFDLFCVLNNGVTIVSSSVTPAGNRFTLRDYQIVNGCQTSHVLHDCRGISGIASVHVPVKIVVTEDEDIKSQITIATNSQTEVKPEQLEALTQFQKKLEQYYNSVKGEGRLYYERRSQQYHAAHDVKKTQVISIPMQIKAFAAAFLNVPHAVSGYYGTIAKRFRGKMFDVNHKYSPYYSSALCYYKLESYFKSGMIDKKYKKIRFHLIMLARMIAMGVDLPPLNSSRIEKLCDNFISKMNQELTCLELFNSAINIFEKSDLDSSQKQFKVESETDKLIRTLKEKENIGQ